MQMNFEALSRAATEARGLCMDAVQASQSGHLGLPLGCAEIGAVLYGYALKHNPEKPRWIGRDYFVLSAGHGSMFLYAWLHMSGYDLPMSEIKRFRQLHSRTPGHPEFGDTPGVECTTGPLGQGVGNAVGIAVACKMAVARFNTAEHRIFDQHVICLAGDGCMQEGVSSEASAFTGHFGLDNLILIYDSNAVTLDAPATATQSEDTGARFKAYGFDVQEINGEDMQAFLDALNNAKENNNGRPKFIISHSLIGKGIPEVAGTYKAHGEAGAKFVDAGRKGLGLPDEHYFVSKETYAYFAEHKKKLLADYERWEKIYNEWRKKNPELAKMLDNGIERNVPGDLLAKIPEFPKDAKLATRKAGSEALQPIAQAMPLLMSGSADLHGSTLNYIKGGEDFTRDNPKGRNIRFGIREHGMCAILNGISYHGLFRASGATFTVFTDYCRASIRLAALAKLPNTYIFTHDSIGVGEDGPTHQPVETISSVRVMPNIDVIRPADPEETAGAFVAAMERTDGPTLIALTRQVVPILNDIDVQARREGVLRGGYIAKKEKGKLDLIIMSCGSELQHALAAAKELGDGVRVVSMPCFERFNRQPEKYRDEVLPKSCRKRISIEAGVPDTWYQYVGLDGKVIGLHRFGLSAPGAEVMKEFGIDAQHVIEAARSLS
ncbi:MAG: transketolase [Verrucomicrobia bacterium]|jgi:transketolase|nr:MAG: transketolase [Verrucomicrobiota bacterium]PYK87526.1 MAG: transketolase [Verrucomicrobiota bacterium]PYL78946.1 MAG: transketolase [Verrucomicrobiota bacterium]